mmetsp:Transcript_6044/g.20618  ORF Transcript_6044/g.20618 Transcript_6044/m.20618 type:complete len:290 (-) Transcript_6044:249-1118(-)
MAPWPLIGALALGVSTPRSSIVTPVGPFCPFRSPASLSVAPGDEDLHAQAGEASLALIRLTLEVESGSVPERDRVRAVADDMERVWNRWDAFLARKRMSGDFQCLEFYWLLDACFRYRYKRSMGQAAELMKYQVDNMRAFVEGRPPLPPPDDLLPPDMDGGSIPPLGQPPPVTAHPFEGMEAAFESDIVRGEYERLLEDHSELISMGASYGQFDPRGKLAFLDALAQVESRWDTFMARFALMGALNEDFKSQADACLGGMGLTVTGLRDCLDEAHDILRKSALADLERS